MEPTPPRGPRTGDYAEDRGRATATTDPERESVEARRRVREAEPPRPPRARTRIAGWPWAAALVIALGFFAWLIYAVWFA